MTEPFDTETLLSKARQGITAYLDQQYADGRIAQGLYEKAKANVMANLHDWLTNEHISRFSPNLKYGIKDAIQAQRWADLTEAFVDEIAFGTGGIRGRAALRDDELRRLKQEGLDARILKGPNTINNIVLLLKSAGVAKYAADHQLKSIVIGYDSRICGKAFAEMVAQLFLASGLRVYLFDEPCPYPELTFAIPDLGADLGILISASHNDRRYNGYKLTSSTGAQLGIEQRNRIYEEYIRKMTPANIQIVPLKAAGEGQLVYLGGDQPLEGVDYVSGKPKLVNMHKRHIDHTAQFILDTDMVAQWAPKVRVGYCAFHGAGRKAVPRLLSDFGFEHVQVIHKLHEIDGMFPAFDRHPEQQPDPGDPDAAEIAVNAFVEEHGQSAFDELDVMIGTDPDADRMGVVVKVPPAQQHIYDNKGYLLLGADDAWTLLLWYRFLKEAEKNGGVLPHADQRFIALSHCTTDGLVALARKYGLGVIKTWVGFAMLSTSIQSVWDGRPLPAVKEGRIQPTDRLCHPIIHSHLDMDGWPRRVNVGALEQSNGFSILGAKPAPGLVFGEQGHVRDKDGTFAAILLAEVAAYAKSLGKMMFELVDEKIYLDPEVGCFITHYEPAPRYGQYEGIEGWTTKINALKQAEALFERINCGEQTEFGGTPALSAVKYQTGKYDALHAWEGFPDEGYRIYFDEAKLNHALIRPSGTSQCLRFHVQLKAEDVTPDCLLQKKAETLTRARRIINDIRQQIGVPT